MFPATTSSEPVNIISKFNLFIFDQKMFTFEDSNEQLYKNRRTLTHGISGNCLLQRLCDDDDDYLQENAD